MIILLYILLAILGIIVFLVALIAIIMMLNIRLYTSYDNDRLRMKATILGIKIYDNSKKKKKLNGILAKNPTIRKIYEADDFDELMGKKESLIKEIGLILRNAKQKIYVEDFKFNLRFGKDDAAKTAVYSGSIWAFVGAVFPVLLNYLNFVCEPELSLTPDFVNPCMELHYKGNFRLKIYHLLVILGDVPEEEIPSDKDKNKKAV